MGWLLGTGTAKSRYAVLYFAVQLDVYLDFVAFILGAIGVAYMPGDRSCCMFISCD